MFTGIITHTGSVRNSRKSGDGLVLTISCPRDFLPEVEIGESISVSGACLTITSFTDDSFTVDVSSETLSHTTIPRWKPGDMVNLERSLQLKDRLGGHFVMGHVDGSAKLKSSKNSGDGKVLTFECSDEICRMIIPKGSVAIDGISLTPIEVENESFSVAVIPHTLKSTTLGNLKTGDDVNVEIDVFARYVWNFLNGLTQKRGSKKGAITLEKLKDEGF